MDSAFSPLEVRAATASVACWPTTPGTVTFGLPLETLITTRLPFSVRSPGGLDWSKTRPTSTVSFGRRRTWTLSPAASSFWTASRSIEPWTSGTADRLRLVQLVLDLRVDVPAAGDRGRDHEQRGEQPRPDRAPAHRLVVLVEAGRRPVRAAARRHTFTGRRTISVGADGDRRHEPGAAQHLRRHLLGLGRDRLPAGGAGEVGVHLLGRLVAVVRALRERAQDDRVELVRDLGRASPTAAPGSPRGASSRSRAACRR